MSDVDAALELLAAALSSAPPLVEVDVDVDLDVLPELVEVCATEVTPGPVDLDVLPELVEVCATEVTPGPVENAGRLSVPQASARAAARARRRMGRQAHPGR